MNIFEELDYKLTELKKFYFFEYFHILLRSVEKYYEKDRAFHHFRTLKENLNLGESRYKKIGSFATELTHKQLTRYRYTFQEVEEEASNLGLIIVSDLKLELTKKGTELLETYNKYGADKFNDKMFVLIEGRTYGFHYLISSLYKINPKNGGTLIFPIYSPLKLHFSKEEIVAKNMLKEYLEVLKDQLEKDIKKHISKTMSLSSANNDLINRLIETKLIGNNYELLDPEQYNLIIKRIRDFWLNFFLRSVYNLKINSLSYFDLWTYRAKQLGFLNVTEFFPSISGKIVYPTSVIYRDITSDGFDKAFEYSNGESLYIHNPKWEDFDDNFISTLYESYLELKRSYSSYFVNLADLRDIVCFKTKISYRKFLELLIVVYNLNLRGQLKISISLEADKLPSENKAIYLKRDPILIDNKLRNIIAIDIK